MMMTKTRLRAKNQKKSQGLSRPTEDDLDVWKEYLLDDLTHLHHLKGGRGVVGVLQLKLTVLLQLPQTTSRVLKMGSRMARTM